MSTRRSHPARLRNPAHEFARSALVALVLATLALAGYAPAPAAAGTDLMFSIGDQVSAEDAAYVREGIALAEEYVAENLTDISDEELVVNVRNSEDTTGSNSIAFSGGTYIAVFTASPGWNDVAPFARVQVIVHEYIHTYQYYHSRTRHNALPAWLVEGMAEYLGYDAVIQRGLVDARDVHAYHAWAVRISPQLPPLEELEGREAFYGEYGPTYSLAYLAVAHLMETLEPADLDRLMKEMRSGQGWRSVFTDVLGMEPDEFYRSFAEEQESMLAPRNPPEQFDFVLPAKVEGDVAIDETSDPIALSEQMTMLGRTEAGAICRLRLRGTESGEAVSGTTFADASGRFFWLLTIPEDIGAGPATVTVNCGGEHTTIKIEIVT